MKTFIAVQIMSVAIGIQHQPIILGICHTLYRDKLILHHKLAIKSKYFYIIVAVQIELR